MPHGVPPTDASPADDDGRIRDGDPHTRIRRTLASLNEFLFESSRESAFTRDPHNRGWVADLDRTNGAILRPFGLLLAAFGMLLRPIKRRLDRGY